MLETVGTVYTLMLGAELKISNGFDMIFPIKIIRIVKPKKAIGTDNLTDVAIKIMAIC